MYAEAYGRLTLKRCQRSILAAQLRELGQVCDDALRGCLHEHCHPPSVEPWHSHLLNAFVFTFPFPFSGPRQAKTLFRRV